MCVRSKIAATSKMMPETLAVLVDCASVSKRGLQPVLVHSDRACDTDALRFRRNSRKNQSIPSDPTPFLVVKVEAADEEDEAGSRQGYFGSSRSLEQSSRHSEAGILPGCSKALRYLGPGQASGFYEAGQASRYSEAGQASRYSESTQISRHPHQKSKPSQLSRYPQKSESALREEAQYECNIILASTYHLGQDSKAPLGYKKVIPWFNRQNPASVVKYLFMVDHFVDTYCENTSPLLTTNVKFSMDLVTEDAFLAGAGKLCDRTLILYEPQFYCKTEDFSKIWCRTCLHYIDWVSHLPELVEMGVDDRLKMVVGRCVPMMYHMVAYRSKDLKKRCIPLSSGTYVPLEEDEMKEYQDKYLLPVYSEIGNLMWENYIDLAKEMNVTNSEFQILRVLAFFIFVPGLSKEGRKAVRKAQAFYSSVLLDVIRTHNPQLNEQQITERISALLCLVPNLEPTSQIEDNHFTVMTMFNISNMKTNLMHEFYIQRKMRSY
ncbi:unnamed protein product [Bursaphelenchus okinawaensis]|uniref:NR LBD domain-containing protein n=1 Tax=Bursaphelenchus okinawaensis TaxID=465554 RepID=A0A811L036_9BILA|nr:unnamed protein product [Bursaphelenchus okinawaensis]CAG9115096.1 unnamed protein product [Bursaphelenchus okinawaensis]